MSQPKTLLRRVVILPVLALLAALTLAAPASASVPASVSATTHLVLGSKSITGLPASLPPGYHTFTFTSATSDLRSLAVLQLKPGYTRDMLKRDLAGSFAQKFSASAYARLTKNVSALGGAEDDHFTVTVPKFTVLLKPGTYILDNGPSENGAPDTYTPIKVTGSSVGSRPTTFGTIASTDDPYGYKVTHAVVGLHTYALPDAGDQIHMYVFLRIDPGHSEAQLLSLLNSGADQPTWVHNGGYAGVISGGQTMYTTLNFSAHFNYEIICFMPDPKTGAPHFLLGMHRFLQFNK